MERLTGRPSEAYLPSQVSMADLAGHLAKGHAVVLATHEDITFSVPKRGAGMVLTDVPDITDWHPGYTSNVYGEPLVPEHGYYVTGVDAAKNTITVRNPWGWHHPPLTIPYDQYLLLFPNVQINRVKS